MTIKRTVKIFCPLMAFAVLFRVLQSLITVEAETGFMYNNLSVLGYFLIAVSLLGIAATGLLAFFNTPTLLCVPPVDTVTCIISFAYATFIFLDVITFKNNGTYPALEVFVIYLFGIACALFFTAYGLKHFFSFTLPEFTYLIPFAYSCVHLIRSFVQTVSISVISDAFFSIICASAQVLYFLEFAKMNNGFSSTKTRQRIFSLGFVLCTVCGAFALPPIIKAVFCGSIALRNGIFTLLSSLVLGAFGVVYSFKFFVKNND